MASAKSKLSIQLSIGLSLSIGLFLAVNLHQPFSGCDDCFAPHGWPFAYYHEGGYGGGAAYVWPGIVADISIVLVAGLLVAWGLNRILAGKRKQ